MTRHHIYKQTTTRGVHYKAALDLGPDPETSKRRQRTKDCQSKREAQSWLDEQVTARGTGASVARGDLIVADTTA